jgi:hypothetical protein
MKWSKEQLNYLKEKYPLYGGKYCAEFLGIHWRKVNSKTYILKLRRSKNPNKILCSHCFELKSTCQFTKESKGKFGVSRICKECRKDINKINYYKNHEKTKAIYREASKKKRLADKINNSPNLIIQRLRHRTWLALRGVGKIDSTLRLLGCTKEEFILYFKSKMTPDMTWEDVLSGKIHIDHIRPVSSFDLSDRKQQKICFHYTNLQPLWARDNLTKGKR